VQFLLFLSAMLAGFTGLMSGDRAVAPHQVEQAVAAASVLAEAAPAAVQSVASAAPARIVATAPCETPPSPAASRLGNLAPVNERRLE